MKLGFDLDEVIVDLTNPLSELANTHYNLELSQDSFRIYNFKNNIYVDDVELNKEIIDFLIYYANDAEFQFKAEPYIKSVNTMRYLKWLHHTVYFITSRPIENTELTKDWLRKYNIPYDELIVLGHGVEKGPVGKNNQLDFFLDDRISHLESMWEHKRYWPVGLFVIDRPWNRYSEKFNRVYDWSDIKDIFTIGGQYA